VSVLEVRSAALEQGGALAELEALVSERVRQRYRILGRLGEGGLGVVLKAEDRVLGRLVALKTVRASEARSAEEHVALLAEARAAAALNHPGIATIYELVEDDGSACIAMELVEGSSLRELLERGPLDPGEAVRIAFVCAEALAAAHEVGIIHCDIKPSNIMVATSGAVKVLDFGLARLARGGHQRGDQQVTGERSGAQPSGIVAGTLAYMAPEQLAGQGVDGRTDIFSLGVVLYEILSDAHPFAGSDILAATLDREPVPLAVLRPGLEPELQHVVRRAIAKDPTQRYQSARELVAELERIVGRTPARARLEGKKQATSEQPVEGVLAQPSWAVRFRRYRGVLLTGIVLGLVGALAFVLSPPIRWLGVGACVVIAVVCATVLVRARRAAAKLPALRQSGIAFRGLLPFAESDRERFFGREAEIASLATLVTAPSYRFGVLYGESGCGKTSLLRAGVMPRLWEAGLVPLYCRLHRDPLAALRDEAQRQTGVAPRPDEPIRDYLRRLAAEHSASVVVIFDQFEEFFINFPEAPAREPFLAFVGDCQRDPSLPVSFLFSVRNDFLYLIGAAFDGRVAEPLAAGSRLLLSSFTPQQANVVIGSSVRAGSLPLEEGLAELLVSDLTHDGRVQPSELQIVGDQLQQRCVLTIRDYRAIGGKEALVHGYLADVLRCARDQEGARLVLRSLISDEGTRITLAASEIKLRTQRSAIVVDECLRLFVQARLVRALQDEEPWRYELVHEYLVDKINRIAGKVMDARQRANRLLRQHLSHFSVEPKTRIPLAQLWFIHRHSDQRDGSQARALMRKSLVRGVLRAAAAVCVVLVVGTVTLALLSVREEWDEKVLDGGHTAAARKLAFSPDGTELISVGEDGRVLAWDFPHRELRRVVDEGIAWVQQVAYSPDGRYVATGTRAGDVAVWSAATGKRVTSLDLLGEEAGAVTFSPNSRLLLTTTNGGITAWRVDEWRPIWHDALGTTFGSFSFTPDGGLVIDGLMRALDSETGRLVRPASEACQGNVLVLSPDGRLSLAVDSKGDVIFCDAARATRLLAAQVFRDHGRAAVFSPDGSLAAAAAEDIVLWDARTLTKLQRLPCASLVWDLRFSPDGRWLVSSHGDGSVLIWNVKERELDGSLNGHSAPARAVAFSPDGTVLASASEDLSVIVWDATSGQKLRVLRGHATRVTAVAFAPDGRSLYSAEANGPIRRWRWLDHPREPERISVPVHDVEPNYDLGISPDGATIVCSRGVFDRDGRDATNASPFMGKDGQVYGVAFSRDGRLAAMGTHIGSLYLLRTGQTIRLVGKGGSPSSLGITDVAFSPRDDRLVVCYDSGEIWFWGIEPFQPLALLGRHAARVKSVAFSPDGRRVVSAGNDAMIALWDVRGRRQIAHIGTYRSAVNGVAFSPSGNRIAAVGFDGSVRTYSLRRTLWGRTLPGKGLL
jgi:WD40 repeat protein/predicted Ser/Thr protein kinase